MRVVAPGGVVTLLAVVVVFVLWVVDHQLTLWQARRPEAEATQIEFTPEREAAIGFALPITPDDYYEEDD